MKFRHAACLAAATVACGISTTRALASVTVEATPATLRTTLGEKFVIRTVTRNGSQRALDTILHLNIVSLSPETYVDPEDWSSSRTRFLNGVPAEGVVTTTWDLQAVNSGSFAVYVAAVPTARRGTPDTSRAVIVNVGGRRSLDPGGALPVALAVPIGLMLLTLGARWRRQRV
jgi:hypothetical protein